MALGEASGTAPIIVVPNQTVFNSLLAAEVPLGKNLETEVVHIRRLDEVVPEIIVETGATRLFLKMDTQGYDLKCFTGASEVMDRILGLLSEVSVQPIYRGAPHYLAAMSEYEKSGFQLVRVCPETSGWIAEFSQHEAD
jgi:hypothetical protein